MERKFANTNSDSYPAARLQLLVDDSSRNDSNGHSSPDSGVNDMSDDRLGNASLGNCEPISVVTDVRQPNAKRQEQQITLMADEQFKIRLKGDTVRHVTGPANITMVSNNGAAGPLHIQAPLGHMVHRLYDDNSGLTQIILRPQHPNMPVNQGSAATQAGVAGQRGHAANYSYHNGSHSQAMPLPLHQQYSNYSSPGSQQAGYNPNSQQPYPAGYHPQYHHHLIQGGNMHTMVHNGSHNNNHSNHGLAADDRATQQHQRSVPRNREKHHQHLHRHKNPDIMQQCYSQPSSAVNHKMSLNGASPRGNNDRSVDQSSCSSSTDSHDTTSEDEKRQLLEALSSVQAPEVVVESRRAVVHITSPDIPENLLPLEQSINTEVQFQLQYTDKKDGPYKIVYEGDATTIEMEDLKPATEHFLRFCAIFDEIRGNLTEPVMFETSPAPPDTPWAPKLCQKSKAFISLKWNAPADNGSKILHYSLEYYKGHENSQYSECYHGPKKEFKVTKLQPAQRYTFRLAAVNNCGKSEYSKETSVFTNGVPPPTPDPPRLSEATLNSLLLTWIKRPDIDKEFVLQKEEENTGHGFLAAYTGPEVSYRVDCLRKSTTYKFRLQSANDDGKSTWSHVITYRTKADLPGSPQKLSVKGKVASSMFRLMWEPPREDGGAEIDSYLTQLDSGTGYQDVYGGAACECSCINLLPGFTYKARVAARSYVGASRWSESMQITTRPVAPGQCSKPWLQGKPKAHVLHLKWAYPESTGGSAIRCCVVQLVKMDNTTREVYRGFDTDCVVAGLSPGRSYLLQVRAVNDAGEGEWSEPVEVISGAGMPEPPMEPLCQVKSAHAILVSWQEPCNNGAKISEYKLEWLKPNQQEYCLLFIGPNLEHEVRSLQVNSEYSFRVQAINSSGPSPHSHHTTATTLASSPAAVHHVRATACTANSIIVSWTESDNNGSEIIQYNIEYGKNLIKCVTDTTETECTIENLDPDTLHRVRVQAVNSVGAGAYSSQVKVVTLSLPPSPPCLECVGTTWNSIRLKWADVERCDEYTVWMSRGRAPPQCVYQGLSQQCRVSKLHELTDHYFTISAANGAGEGPQSIPLAVTTARTPPHSLKAPTISETGEDYCVVSWQTAKPFPGDSIEYRLQISEQGTSNFHDCKQVYQSSGTSHRLRELTAGSSYSVRVCAVRVCNDSEVESIVGAYSPGVTFRTNKPVSVTAALRLTDTKPKESHLKTMVQRVLSAVRPDQDKQLYLFIAFILFVIGIVLALLAHYFFSL